MHIWIIEMLHRTVALIRVRLNQWSTGGNDVATAVANRIAAATASSTVIEERKPSRPL